MASVTTRNNGSRFISFIDAGRKPRFITLGRVPLRYAEAVKVKVEDLVSATMHQHSPRDDTARWLAGVDDRLYEKLAKADLVQPRTSVTFGGWLEQYVSERKGDLKPESLRKLKQTKTKLLAFFDANKELRKLTLQDATDWRQFLKGLKLSEAAVKTHSGNAKTMFAETVRRRLVLDNPFALLKSGPTPQQVFTLRQARRNRPHYRRLPERGMATAVRPGPLRRPAHPQRIAPADLGRRGLRARPADGS